jgi:hypothetical protein
MYEEIEKQLRLLNIYIETMKNQKENIAYDEYESKYRKDHIDLVKEKWTINQKLFELLHKDKIDNPEKYVPKNQFYCYSNGGRCPFWSSESNFEHQTNGYCYLLKMGDWDHDEGWSLIWDMVKECSINDARYCERCEVEIENLGKPYCEECENHEKERV